MADENQNIGQNPTGSVPNISPPQPQNPSPQTNPTVDPIAAPKSPAPPSGVGNTSGQGSGAVVPEEVKGWSWGAFLLSWIWGIGNSVWLALLILVPVPMLGLVMWIVLGVKGREWAWQYKRWDSIEHFNRVQRKWAIAGVIFLAISIIVPLIMVVALVALNPTAKIPEVQEPQLQQQDIDFNQP